MSRSGLTLPLIAEDFAACWSDVSEVIDLNADLPARPFVDHGGYVAVADFDWLWSAESVLEALAARHGDEEIMLVLPDPAPAHYKKYWGLCPGFRIKPDVLFDGFADAIDYEPNGDGGGTFRIQIEQVALTGSSKRWSVWASRGWEVMLVHDSAGPGPWMHVGVPFMPPSQAFPRYLRGLPAEFPTTFKSNFADPYEGVYPSANRAPTEGEAALLDYLLTVDFPGVEALRVQCQHVRVHGLWRNLPGVVIFDREDGDLPQADIPYRGMPVGAQVKNTEPPIEVLLFVSYGVLDSIAVVDHRGEPQPFLPHVADLEPPSLHSASERREPHHHPWPPPAPAGNRP